jgi:hypothetical protein
MGMLARRKDIAYFLAGYVRPCTSSSWHSVRHLNGLSRSIKLKYRSLKEF